MKKIFLLLLFMISILVTKAQNNKTTNIKIKSVNMAALLLYHFPVNPIDTLMLHSNFDDLPVKGIPWFYLNADAKIYNKEERDSIINNIHHIFYEE